MLLLSLVACLINTALYEERRAALADADGDGSVFEDDCDDRDPAAFPGAQELCNERDDDCDGLTDNDAVDAPTWFADADDDDHGDSASAADACEAPQGFVATDDDCDDTSAGVYPGTTETCDGIDEDCDDLVDDDATDAPAWFADRDGDGHGDASDATSACDAPAGYVASDDDCDDTSPLVSPSAEEQWYDGIDQACDGGDDFDADGDGDASDEYSGTDCDDTDATIAGTLDEGWIDAGIDNNCDGSVEDQVLVDVSEIAVEVAGDTPNASLGAGLLAVPPGWIDTEAVLLAGAPFAGGGSVYGWRASELGASTSLATAHWQLSGTATDDYLGYGMGWGGSTDEPVVMISAEGASDGRGEVYAWSRDGFGGAPDLTVTGGTEGSFLGSRILSSYDDDGDGLDDLVVSASSDSRVATFSGAVFVFHDIGALGSAATTDEADVEFTNSHAGALLSVSGVGDCNGDGADDLGFSLDIAFEEGAGGVLVAGGTAIGSWDVDDVSFAQVYGGPFVFSQAWDTDGDGRSTILAASGGIHSFDLPISGAVTPWDNATGSLEFDLAGPGASLLRTDIDGFAGHIAFLAMSAGYDGSRGMVSVQSPYWAAGQAAEDARFIALGDAAGDALGDELASLDWDDDGVNDLAVGASGADAGGSGSGSVFLIPGPR